MAWHTLTRRLRERRDEPRCSFIVHEFSSSQAATLYIKLAGHDYLETNKQWPPAGSQLYDDATVNSWRSFIAEFPWFPGTDDAMYRLAYALYRAERYKEALDVVLESLRDGNPTSPTATRGPTS